MQILDLQNKNEIQEKFVLLKSQKKLMELIKSFKMWL